MKYPVLRIFANIAIVVGWITVVLGVIALLMVFANNNVPAQQNDLSGFATTASHYVAWIVAGALFVIGLNLIIIGETIKVFLDTEENTRGTRDEIIALRVALTSAAAPPVAGPPTCASCGTVNPTGSRFCENCGKGL